MKKSVLPGSAAAATARYARDDDDESGSLTRGDAAILRFLQALETMEADLWRQYAERSLPHAALPRLISPSPPGSPVCHRAATARRRHAQVKKGSGFRARTLLFCDSRPACEAGASRLSCAEFRLIPPRRPWDSAFPLRPSRAA
jgi:hypothetical protein